KKKVNINMSSSMFCSNKNIKKDGIRHPFIKLLSITSIRAEYILPIIRVAVPRVATERQTAVQVFQCHIRVALDGKPQRCLKRWNPQPFTTSVHVQRPEAVFIVSLSGVAQVIPDAVLICHAYGMETFCIPQGKPSVTDLVQKLEFSRVAGCRGSHIQFPVKPTFQPLPQRRMRIIERRRTNVIESLPTPID